ncbi:MAG TPA: hypothetical protein VKX49_18545 [Bryobacteraceae bacterium]|nr:hypothetical protein [Bryobacteraceae bacterium]
MYYPGSTFDLSGIYDDVMENLRVRYVVRYKSTNSGDLRAPRMVRVELIEPETGGPLELVDTKGKTVPSRIFVENSYIPSSTSQAARKISRAMETK